MDRGSPQHVYEVWCHGRSMGDELEHLVQLYFLSETEANATVSSDDWHLLHNDLTRAERRELTATFDIYCALVQRWQGDRKRGCAIHHHSSFIPAPVSHNYLRSRPPQGSPAFRARYPLPIRINEAEIVQKILRYLQELEDAVKRVEDILEETE